MCCYQVLLPIAAIVSAVLMRCPGCLSGRLRAQCASVNFGDTELATCLSCKPDDPSYCYDCNGRVFLREDAADWEAFYADGNGRCLRASAWVLRAARGPAGWGTGAGQLCCLRPDGCPHIWPLPRPRPQCPDPYCSECQTGTGACKECRLGYGLVNGTCQACKQGWSSDIMCDK